MKKLFLAAALFLVSGTTAWAESNGFAAQTVCAAADEEFAPIDVKELPAAVVPSVESRFPGAMISAAAVKTDADGARTFRVSLTDRAGAEHLVLLSEAGEVHSDEVSGAVSEPSENFPADDEVLD